MFGQNNADRERQRQIAIGSVSGFATVTAAMLAMLGAPILNELTSGYVVALVRRSYPPELIQFAEFAWMVACFPFVFFAARASIGVALVAGGSALAYRLL